MHGLWLWTVTIFSFALFLRGEEPLRLKLRHLKLPQNCAGKFFSTINLRIEWTEFLTFPRVRKKQSFGNFLNKIYSSQFCNQIKFQKNKFHYFIIERWVLKNTYLEKTLLFSPTPPPPSSDYLFNLISSQISRKHCSSPRPVQGLFDIR